MPDGKHYSVVLTAEAVSDYENTQDYYAQFGLATALKFISAFKTSPFTNAPSMIVQPLLESIDCEKRS